MAVHRSTGRRWQRSLASFTTATRPSSTGGSACSCRARLHSQRLATLAYQFRHDALTHEKQSIDHIIAVLSEDKDYDIKHRDFCTEEFNRNQLQTEEKGCEKFDLIGKIQDLKISIKTLTEETVARPRLATLAYQIRHEAFTHVKQAINHMECYLPGDLHHHPCSGKPPRLQRAICFNRHGYFFVCLYWTGFGLPANIVEVYILLSIVSAPEPGRRGRDPEGIRPLG